MDNAPGVIEMDENKTTGPALRSFATAAAELRDRLPSKTAGFIETIFRTAGPGVTLVPPPVTVTSGPAVTVNRIAGCGVIPRLPNCTPDRVARIEADPVAGVRVKDPRTTESITESAPATAGDGVTSTGEDSTVVIWGVWVYPPLRRVPPVKTARNSTKSLLATCPE
jgi:hypothetical protein